MPPDTGGRIAWGRVLVWLLLWPLQAVGQSTDGFRGLVVAGDVAAVETALRAAVVSEGEAEGQRAMFDLFTDTQPEVAAFTTDWLAPPPTPPMP
jgi:hypothetical protein